MEAGIRAQNRATVENYFTNRRPHAGRRQQWHPGQEPEEAPHPDRQQTVHSDQNSKQQPVARTREAPAPTQAPTKKPRQQAMLDDA